MSTAISGEGEGGNVILEIIDTARFVGSIPLTDSSSAPSTAVSSIRPGGAGQAGDVRIYANTLLV